VVGESEKRLAELFRMARSIAPCFILLDNIEVILGAPSSLNASSGAAEGKRHRTRTTHKAIDRILSTLLMELDGIEDPSERKNNIENPSGGQVIVIATMSSHPKTLDRYRLLACLLADVVYFK
jgi:SpoVK/Ycf46/Vps4 family AAA+-type ATPase